MSDANKALIRRLVEEGVNQRNFSLVKEVCKDCVYTSPVVGELRGEALMQLWKTLEAAFPDGKQTILEQIAEGDKVVTRWTFTATHKGEFMGIAPTGKRVTITGMCIDRIVNGKVVEEREESDALGMLRQLGVLPATLKTAIAA